MSIPALGRKSVCRCGRVTPASSSTAASGESGSSAAPEPATSGSGETAAAVIAFAVVTLGDVWTATFARYYIHVDCGSQFVGATSGLILMKACSVRLSAPSANSGSSSQPGPPSSAASGGRAKTPAEICNLLGNDVLQVSAGGTFSRMRQSCPFLC